MNMARVGVVHLAIVFGIFAVALTGSSQAIFVVFIVLQERFAISRRSSLNGTPRSLPAGCAGSRTVCPMCIPE